MGQSQRGKRAWCPTCSSFDFDTYEDRTRVGNCTLKIQINFASKSPVTAFTAPPGFMESTPFQCAHCDYSCGRKFNIKRHIDKHHGVNVRKNNASIKSALCNTCGNLFLNKFNLDRHMRTIHKIKIGVNGTNTRKVKEKSMKCNECASLFGSRASLYRHKVANHAKASIREKTTSTSNIPENLNISFTNDDVINCRNILITFPSNYKYYVVKFKSDCKIPPLLECEFPISDVAEIKKWKADYEKLNKIFFRKNTVRKSIKESVLYKEKFHCGHFMRHSKQSRCYPERHTNCPVRLHLRAIVNENRLIARVKLVGNHNHPTNCAASTKFRPVSEEVRAKFLGLFHDGFTPAKAFRLHYQNLKEEYKDEFHKIQTDRYYCPSMKWVVRLHSAVFKSKCQAAC